MITALKKQFLEIFEGSENGLRVFSSPGRVNLMGEHTDYNGGYVMPAALTMATTIIARPRQDKIIRMAATDLDGVVEGSLDTIDKYKTLKWGNYQFGVFSELQKAGYNVCGADMLFHDTTPHGGGLSSSAAIEVSAAIAMASLGGATEIDGIEMAKISQLSEHNYIGVNCGIMDQFASAMGKKNHLIFLNCKTLAYKLIPISLDGYKLVISNTNKKRSLADSKYNERRSECEKGLEILKSALQDKQCLGDISASEFESAGHLIDDPVIYNRVLHIISEDDRVLKAIDALNNGDLVGFGKLMTASHTSLRDLYEVSCKELDTLVDSALKIDGVLGSRMTGAGFGGCTVSLVREDCIDTFTERVGKEYIEGIGYPASFYVSEIGDGGKEIILP